MRHLRIAARAPSNIALIKYMGKKDAPGNLPENPSLSMTLNDLCTWVEVEASDQAGSIRWISEAPRLSSAEPSWRVPRLGDSGLAKVLKHAEKVRALSPRPDRALILRSANTFPEASGIASSASSFAALTLAVAAACSTDPEKFKREWEDGFSLRRSVARISREGSGSSCRSFEGPWVRWEGEETRTVASKLPDLAHFVILISDQAKSVSSSQAHARVKTSPLWKDRPQRAAARLAQLEAALEAGDLPRVARLSWTESWEMHSLFHTCAEPFSYWQPGTIEALHWFAPRIEPNAVGTPPIVTLDAGPNLHVIVEAASAESWRKELQQRFGAQAILEDRPGLGARFEILRGQEVKQ